MKASGQFHAPSALTWEGTPSEPVCTCVCVCVLPQSGFKRQTTQPIVWSLHRLCRTDTCFAHFACANTADDSQYLSVARQHLCRCISCSWSWLCSFYRDWMGVTLLQAAVFILGTRGVTAGLDYPLLLDKAVTALSGGQTFLYLALSFA